MIPEGWIEKKFGDITRIANGQVDPTVPPYNQYLHIGPENVVSGNGQIKNIKTCSELGLVSGKYAFDEKALVYSKIRPNLNKVCAPNFPGVCSADMYPIWTKNNDELNKNFLLHYMLSHPFVARAVSTSMRTGLPKINRDDLNAIKLSLPPLKEQRKISYILSTWDKAIEVTKKLIENSQAQKKALMQQLLTGKKRLKGFEKEWKLGHLKDLCQFKGGSAFKDKYQGLASGDYPFIKVSDMNLPKNSIFIKQANNWVNEKEMKEMKAKLFPSKTIVFAKVGAALLLNRRRILERETIIDNNMMAAVPNKDCSSSFLYQLMLMIDFAKFVQDGAVPSVNQSDLSRLKIKLPLLEEQQKIAAILSAADKEIELLQQKLAFLQQEKKALMQQLLTGKRRVKVDEGSNG